MTSDVSKITQAILDIEHSINERWNNGDCSGYIETYSEDVTYFDPATEKLLVGRKTVEDHIQRLYKNPHIVRSEYLNPQVSVSDDGNLAVLSYNLRNFVADEAGGEKLLTHWNSTEVYSLDRQRVAHRAFALVVRAAPGDYAECDRVGARSN
jgi:ketosteroid isomerase-like protein